MAIACSTGSACAAGVLQPSHVLLACGVDEAEARGALRFSLGWTSTADDVDHAARGAAARSWRGPGPRGSPRRGDRRWGLTGSVVGRGRRGAPACARTLGACACWLRCPAGWTRRSPRPGGRRGARRGRRAHGAVAHPRRAPHGFARLLHHRGRVGRAPERRRAGHPVLRVGPVRAVRARPWSRTSSPSTPQGARRTRACGATSTSSSRPCWTGRRRWASTRWHRPLRADRHRAGRDPHAAPRRATSPRTSRTCSP